MNYKKIIKSKELRFKILSWLEFIPDKVMVRLQYWIKTGKILNLKHPKRFNEKIQWYKLFYRDPLMTKCADKYRVREYVASKGYEEILIPLCGAYDCAEEIDFDKLPDEFVLKTTNGSHTNIICRNKKKLNIRDTVNTLNSWLKQKSVKLGREWAYYNIEPKIVCEQFLKDSQDVNSELKDYKFLCFDGEVKYIWVDVNRSTNHKRNFYDVSWNYLEVESDVPSYGDNIEKPEGLKKMLEIAQRLSEEFPHVRVDLYWVNNKVYFGELTFYLLSGYESFYPDNFDYVLGREFNLPEVKTKV
ncbi:ATP-grasp fold amidoligase family protein [Proteinivorax hydrogeniformans]|uniref:ATP-grasp fold amidoligase family protein n=1 Tax=Proteinivorax hydrogeniformans TaxID=1826727 RepID=A0AAU8HWX6_9FIRM